MQIENSTFLSLTSFYLTFSCWESKKKLQKKLIATENKTVNDAVCHNRDRSFLSLLIAWNRIDETMKFLW